MTILSGKIRNKPTHSHYYALPKGENDGESRPSELALTNGARQVHTKYVRTCAYDCGGQELPSNT